MRSDSKSDGSSLSDRAWFHLRVLEDCQKYGFPCIPDIDSPVVSVYYIAARWIGHTDDHSVKEMIETARERGLIVCTIRRQPCIYLSSSAEIIIASASADRLPCPSASPELDARHTTSVTADVATDVAADATADVALEQRT